MAKNGVAVVLTPAPAAPPSVADRTPREPWVENLRVAVIVGVIAAHVAGVYALDIRVVPRPSPGLIPAPVAVTRPRRKGIPSAEGRVSEAQANEIHDKMTRAGFWDSTVPFPEAGHE